MPVTDTLSSGAQTCFDLDEVECVNEHTIHVAGLLGMPLINIEQNVGGENALSW
jgi:hypothetical protein